MNNELEKLKKQHATNYKKAVLEIIKNNTSVLVNEDIMSLFKKPPLDSMDVIKCKFLDLAKKYKIVLDIEYLSKIVDNYRQDVIGFFDEISNYRIEYLTNVVNSEYNEADDVIVKINKKDFIDINKHNKKIIKDSVLESVENTIVNNVNSIFTKNIDDISKNKFTLELEKFLKKAYIKQIIENVDFKVLVKDTILINSIKEQGERYLFTMQNSRIFNEQV